MYDRRLEAISAAAELGSFSRAAAKLRVSTPALVKQVSGFEAEFGITLFERSHSGVKVTPAGALLVDDARSIMRQSEDALRRALYLMADAAGVKAQWLRGFCIYGDDMASRSIFGKILRAAAAGEASFPFTSGKNEYDFITVDELAAQISACVMQDEVLGTINCCSGVPVSLGEQVEGFIRRHDLPIKLAYGAYPDRPYDSPGVWGDATKVRAAMAAAEGVR